MRTLLALALLTVPGFAAPVPKELKKKFPLEQLLGDWEMVSHDFGNGQASALEGYTKLNFSMCQDKGYAGKLLAEMEGIGKRFSGIMVCDFAHRPMQMDLDDPRGIFEFVGGRLHWYVAQPGQPRPTEFKGSDGVFRTIWKRAEK